MSADTTTPSTTARTRSVAASLALASGAGLLWGLMSSLVNAAPLPWLQAVSRITGERWSWCVVAFCIGFALRNVKWSPVLGAAGMVAAMVGYYGLDLARGVYSRGGGVKWDWLVGDFVSWTTIGVVAGAVFAFAGALTRRGGVVGAVALLALPATVMYPDVLARRPLGFLDHLGVLTWLALLSIAVSVVMLVRALAKLAQQRGRRGLA